VRPNLVLYHGGCRDGFAAAWVAHRAMPDAEFRAVSYGQPAPIADALDRWVYVLDFCYPLAEMVALSGAAKQLFVLDHHKTAEAALRDFKAANAKVIFDMERSGAGITADWFLSGTETRHSPPPWPVAYVEDRDLWRFKLADSEVVNAYLSIVPFDFVAWDDLNAKHTPASVFTAGRAVEAKTANYVAEVRKNARRVTFEGHDVPIVNAPQVDISELVGAMCDGETFAMGWWQRSDGQFSYSLRSRGDFDVSALATKHGGGGHKNAAGFLSASLIGELTRRAHLKARIP